MSNHHPSCRESDKDLVWLCGQCGEVESAADIEEVLDLTRKKLKQVQDAEARQAREIKFLREEILAYQYTVERLREIINSKAWTNYDT